MASRRSRVHPKYKTKYRVTNWALYDRALVRRGDVTLWFTQGARDGRTESGPISYLLATPRKVRNRS